MYDRHSLKMMDSFVTSLKQKLGNVQIQSVDSIDNNYLEQPCIVFYFYRLDTRFDDLNHMIQKANEKLKYTGNVLGVFMLSINI